MVGTILIDGPATANYDIDLGTFPMMDWYYKNADVVNTLALINSQAGGGAPPSDTLLLNGTNNNGAGGKYQSVALTKGKKHRLRLINTSVDSHMMVKLDSHPFTVVSADFGCTACGSFTANSSGFTRAPWRVDHMRVNSAPKRRIIDE